LQRFGINFACAADTLRINLRVLPVTEGFVLGFQVHIYNMVEQFGSETIQGSYGHEKPGKVMEF